MIVRNAENRSTIFLVIKPVSNTLPLRAPFCPGALRSFGPAPRPAVVPSASQADPPAESWKRQGLTATLRAPAPDAMSRCHWFLPCFASRRALITTPDRFLLLFYQATEIQGFSLS